MNKLIAFLLLFFVVLSCNNVPNANSDNGELNVVLDPNGNEVSKENAEKRIQFDSLMNLVQTIGGRDNYELKSKYLSQSLSYAMALNNDTLLANVFLFLGNHLDNPSDYATTIDYYYKALSLFEKLNNNRGAAVTLNNMSWVYIQALDNNKGIECIVKGIQFANNLPDNKFRFYMRALLYNNLSIAYLQKGLPDSALMQNELANASFLNYNKKDLNLNGWINAQFGSIYLNKNNYSRAEEYLSKVIEIKDSVSAEEAAVFAISRYCNLLNKTTRHQEAINMGANGLVLARKSGRIRYLIDIADELRFANEKLQQIDSAYSFSKLATEMRDSIFNAKKTIQLQSMSFIRELKANELKYEIERVKTEEKLANEERRRNILLGGFVFVLMFAGVFLFQRNKIKEGKIRSDELLLNILPGEVAEELKQNGSAKAKLINEVTVLFTDFKGFTELSEKLTPTELVDVVNECFSAFDHIMVQFGVEKIKTIGDAYMAAGGLPTPNATHANDVVHAALAIQQYMLEHKAKREQEGKLFFEIRIGVHSGPVVAGIVGVKKFAYDIWGDTVNIASRMESSGELGKVNISETTYEMVKNNFKCNYRGKIQAKGKGEIDMYFVEGVVLDTHSA